MKKNTKQNSAKSSLLGLAAGLAVLTAVGTARAERIYGVTNVANAAGALVYFDSASPASVTTVATITGGTNIRAIDFRPSDGQLYAVGYTGATGAIQLYTINLATAVATAVGGGFTLPGAQNTTRLSIDVNPMANALRVITDNGSSYRLSLSTGLLAAQDTTFSGSIGNAFFADVAYTGNTSPSSSTLLYAYEFQTDSIVLVNPPNSGTYTVVGGLGGPSASAGDVGFDISGVTGTAYLSLDDIASADAVDEFYSINLATGTATLIGSSTVNLLDISAVTPVPEPGTIALLGVTGAIGAVMARRRRRCATV